MFLLELILPIFVVFCFYGLGACTIFFFNKSSKLPLEITTTFGSATFAFLIGSLIPFWELNLVCNSIICLSLIFGIFFIFKEKMNLKIKYKIYIFPLLFYFLIMFFFSFYPSHYPDPLNYHLVGIATWIKENNLINISSRIPLAHISYGDYLFFPFSIFNSLRSNNDLIEFQICSQVLHFILGILLFSKILFRILENSIDKKWALLIILAAITRASLQHKAIIAKNDWFALTWFLAGIWFLLNQENESKKLHIWLAGFLFGISIGAKFSYFIAFVFLLIFALRFKQLKDRKQFSHFILSFTISLSPYLIRNYLWTENPIFPLASSIIGQNFLGPSWIRGLRNFDVNLFGFHFSWFFSKIHRFFTYDFYTYLILIPLFWFKLLHKIIQHIYFFLFVTMIFFIFFTGEFAEIRHLGPLAVLINILGIYSIYWLCLNFKLIELSQGIIIGTIYVIIFWNISVLNEQISPIPKIIKNELLFDRKNAYLHSNVGLLTSNYLIRNMQFSTKNKIAVIDDTPMYFLLHFPAIKIWDDFKLDKEINSCEDLKCVLMVLKKNSFKYIFETGTIFDPYYNPNIYFGLINLINHKQDSIIYSIEKERLIEIDKLLN